VTHEHLAHSHLLIVDGFEPEATSRELMVQCSRHVIPPAIQVHLTDHQAHDLAVELNAPSLPVLTCQRLSTSLAHEPSKVVDPH